MAMEHYFSSEPTAKKIETEVSFEVDGVKFDMTAASGTFSSTQLDPGTKVLFPILRYYQKMETFLIWAAGGVR